MRTNITEREVLCTLLHTTEDDLAFNLSTAYGRKRARKLLDNQAGQRVLTTKGRKFYKKLAGKLVR